MSVEVARDSRGPPNVRHSDDEWDCLWADQCPHHGERLVPVVGLGDPRQLDLGHYRLPRSNMRVLDACWWREGDTWIADPGPFLLHDRDDAVHCLPERGLAERVGLAVEASRLHLSQRARRYVHEGLRKLLLDRHPQRRCRNPNSLCIFILICRRRQVDYIFLGPLVAILGEWACRMVQVKEQLLAVVHVVDLDVALGGAVWRPPLATGGCRPLSSPLAPCNVLCMFVNMMFCSILYNG